MIEREKQKETTGKQKPEETRHTQGDTSKPETRQAKSSTDPEAVKDKGYIERIEEKTEKH